MAYDNRPENVIGEKFKLRLTPEMKQWAFNKAASESTTVSNVLRNLIAEAMKQS